MPLADRLFSDDLVCIHPVSQAISPPTVDAAGLPVGGRGRRTCPAAHFSSSPPRGWARGGAPPRPRRWPLTPSGRPAVIAPC